MTFYVPLWGEGERPHSAVGKSEKHSSGTFHEKRGGVSSMLPPSPAVQGTLPHPKEILTKPIKAFGHQISAEMGFIWLIPTYI